MIYKVHHLSAAVVKGHLKWMFYQCSSSLECCCLQVVYYVGLRCVVFGLFDTLVIILISIATCDTVLSPPARSALYHVGPEGLLSLWTMSVLNAQVSRCGINVCKLFHFTHGSRQIMLLKSFNCFYLSAFMVMKGMYCLLFRFGSKPDLHSLIQY